jgi:hypothetical protein
LARLKGFAEGFERAPKRRQVTTGDKDPYLIVIAFQLKARFSPFCVFHVNISVGVLCVVCWALGNISKAGEGKFKGYTANAASVPSQFVFFAFSVLGIIVIL